MDSLDRISGYFWWHSIDLGQGVTTPGIKSAELMRREAGLLFDGVDLAGKSFLDVGAWNGGFSVEAARRGATRIAGLDHYTWNHPEFRGLETYKLVSDCIGIPFETHDVDLDTPRLSLAPLGQFDVVLYSGVFYHLVDPIAATREIAERAKDLLILETHVEVFADPRPAMMFYPGAELNNDATNWWGPNNACIVALLNRFGFPRVDVKPGSDDKRSVFHAYRG